SGDGDARLSLRGSRRTHRPRRDPRAALALAAGPRRPRGLPRIAGLERSRRARWRERVTPGEVFDPSAALDPTRFIGPEGAAHLLSAAQHFPGGPVGLVLMLFFAPVGPGIPAGVLLARHVPLNPVLTFGLYA